MEHQWAESKLHSAEYKINMFALSKLSSCWTVSPAFFFTTHKKTRHPKKKGLLTSKEINFKGVLHIPSIFQGDVIKLRSESAFFVTLHFIPNTVTYHNLKKVALSDQRSIQTQGFQKKALLIINSPN